MLLYYRLLGVVVILGLGLSAGATYALVAYLSNSGVNLTLSLAGVTGLIVSVGITVDSYVVYFERLKDEVRAGKTVRSSVDRGFSRAFRTILAADLVSLIGAVALYFLASGSVKGFAFFLGLSTLLDLLVAFFFMHPAVVILSRRRQLVRVPVVGIASGLDAKEATA
jgi:preprotein translocase subunit SecD